MIMYLDYINYLFVITLNLIVFFIFFILIKNIKSFPNDEVGGIQKVHSGNIPRVGGMILLISIIISNFFFSNDNISLILYSFIPILIISLLEDLNIKLNPKIRIIFIALSSFFIIYFLNLSFNDTNIEFIDKYILSNLYLSLLLIFVMIIGLVNAFNFIDGLNGLMCLSTISILFFYSLTSHNYEYEGIFWITSLLLILYATLLIFNFPKSFIFFGDTGAYFAGFNIAVISLLIASKKDFSPFYQLAICSYPTTEVIFSFFRKIFYEKQSPMMPDNKHLHIMIYSLLSKKISSFSNPLSTFIIILFNFIYLTVVNFFIYSQSSLILLFLLFIIIYISVYLLVRKKFSSMN